MPDVVYSVAVEYLQSGGLSLPPGLKNAGESLEKAQRGFASVGRAADGFNSMLDSIGSTIAGTLMSAATGVGTVLAGGFALALKEAFHFNQEMENTTIGLANMANAAGTTANFGGAMRLAGDVVKQMRTDAKELPGEFKDLQNIMALIEPSTANAGMGLFGTEKIASGTMVAAKMLNVPMAVAGREMAMMLSGSARHSMPLFTKLGFTDAKAFNHMSQADRMSAVQSRLDKLNTPEALGVIKHTWETIKSTAIDSVRQTTAAIGGPLFERVKDVVFKFNELGKNEGLREQWMRFATKFGNDLVRAFDYGYAGIQKWFGPVTAFLGVMERGIGRIFGGLSPMFEHLVGRLEHFLNDPAAFSKIEHLVASIVALRVGSGVVGAAGSMAPGMLGMISSLSGGGAAGAAAAGAAVLPLAIAIGVAAIALGGFTSALLDSKSAVHETAVVSLKTTAAATSRLYRELDKWADNVKIAAEVVGVGFARVVEHVVGTLADLVNIANTLGGAFMWVIGQIPGLGGPKLGSQNWGDDDFAKSVADDLQSARVEEMQWNINSIKKFNTMGEPGDIGAKPPPVHNTTIHKIEIKVDGDADPQRVAKLTVDLLFDKVRNPTSSTGGPPRFDLGF